MKYPPTVDRGVLEMAACGGYLVARDFDVSHCRRFNYPIVNSSETPMTRRDTEVVPSPLVEQRQEDGQRHHSAGTLEHRFPFCSQIVPRENHVFSGFRASKCQLAAVRRRQGLLAPTVKLARARFQSSGFTTFAGGSDDEKPRRLG